MLVLLFNLALSLDTNNCTNINCDSSISPYCMKILSNQISVNPCDSGYECLGISKILSQASDFINISCTPSPTSQPVLCGENWGPGNNPAGWTCCSNQNCLSNNCESSICQGKSIGSACTVDEECTTYSYCNKTCTNLLWNGDKCSKDNQCPIGNGCNMGICTELFSVNIGNFISDPKFCRTNFSINGTCDALQISSDNSIADGLYPPYVCDIGSPCYYFSINFQKLYSIEDCLCSGSTGTTGYCPIIKGVSLVDFTSRIGYNSSSCSGFLAHTIDPTLLYTCDSILAFDEEFYIQVSTQRIYWPIFQSQSLLGCAEDLEIFNPILYGSGGRFIIVYLSILLFI
jgi:hypothetical protein